MEEEWRETGERVEREWTMQMVRPKEWHRNRQSFWRFGPASVQGYYGPTKREKQTPSLKRGAIVIGKYEWKATNIPLDHATIGPRVSLK